MKLDRFAVFVCAVMAVTQHAQAAAPPLYVQRSDDPNGCMDEKVFFILPYEAYAGVPFDLQVQVGLTPDNVDGRRFSGAVGVACSDPQADFQPVISMSPDNYGHVDSIATVRTTGYVTFDLMCHGVKASRRTVFVVGGEAHRVALVALDDMAVRVGDTIQLHLQLLDAFDNLTDDSLGRIELSCTDPLARLPDAIALNARTYEFVFGTAGDHIVTVHASSARGILTHALAVSVRGADG